MDFKQEIFFRAILALISVFFAARWLSAFFHLLIQKISQGKSQQQQLDERMDQLLERMKKKQDTFLNQTHENSSKKNPVSATIENREDNPLDLKAQKSLASADPLGELKREFLLQREQLAEGDPVKLDCNKFIKLCDDLQWGNGESLREIQQKFRRFMGQGDMTSILASSLRQDVLTLGKDLVQVPFQLFNDRMFINLWWQKAIDEMLLPVEKPQEFLLLMAKKIAMAKEQVGEGTLLLVVLQFRKYESLFLEILAGEETIAKFWQQIGKMSRQHMLQMMVQKQWERWRLLRQKKSAGAASEIEDFVVRELRETAQKVQNARLNKSSSVKNKKKSLSSDTFTLEEARALLQVGANATEKEVKKAFNKWAKQSHPDKLAGDIDGEAKQEAQRQFLRYRSAYEILGQDFLRKKELKKILFGPN